MPAISIRNINNCACHNVNLDIHDKEFMVILGPNGSGKTTLLNIIAGLAEYQGTVMFDGVPIDRVQVDKRGIGYLLQNLVLFPHMDVYRNIAYGLWVKKESPKTIEQRVNELLKTLNISHLSTRYPGSLSGGEKQRVALARALIMSPKVLLLDEPLSSLDAQTSKYLRSELKQIQRKLGITTIYVTHSFTEAEEMADRIAILHNGNVEQVGNPYEIFFSPSTDKVSEFVGMPNILECDYCRETGYGIVEVGCGDLHIIVPHDGNLINKIAIYPRDVYISDSKPPGPDINRFKGVVTGIKMIGDLARINVEVGGIGLLSELPRYVFDELDIALRKEVFLILKLRRIRTYEQK